MVRRIIQARLTARTPATDPRARTLADAAGPVSSELEALLRSGGCPSAVLVGLIERPGGLTVLLTQRAGHLTAHPGQVSFPGGRIEQDDGSPITAALREAHEEIGLKPEAVSIVGCLDRHMTVTGFLVTPVVGFVDPGFEATPDVTEVEAVFEVPLEYLLDDANLGFSLRQRNGTTFRIYEFHYDGRRIWGATAAILVGLKDILST
ncbi:MAG TPA: CoA pyrophosphatase [Gammaproteobacteria bacterium]|jgi:8-oxo-dGTP pyrophosphatase MutT (NUDIX family)